MQGKLCYGEEEEFEKWLREKQEEEGRTTLGFTYSLMSTMSFYY